MTTCGKIHNVLILDNELGVGGVEKKLYDFVSGIDTSHFRPIICCLKRGGYFKEAFQKLGVPFHEGILHHRYDVFAYRRLLRIIEEEQIELIYTFAHPNTLGLSWMARTRGRIRALVVSFHATGSPSGGRLLKGYQRPMLRGVDRMLAVAFDQRRYLVDIEGLEEENIVVIHNGVDTDKYHPRKGSEDVAASFGIEDGEQVVTTVASLNPRKRIDLLLRVAAAVVPGHPKVRFVVAGDGPERGRLHAIADTLGIGDKVVFTGVRDDVDALLRSSTVFVLCSRRGTETFPNVILEAMSSGLPVVTTDVGSVRELVADGDSGIIVPEDDEQALTTAISGLLADRDTAARFGARGRQIVEEQFRLEDMCRKREAVLADLLCGPPGKP